MDCFDKCRAYIDEKIKNFRNAGNNAAVGGEAQNPENTQVQPGTVEGGGKPALWNQGNLIQKWGDFWNKRGYRLITWCVLLLILIFLPIKMGPVSEGHGPNAGIPIIGGIESVCARESNRIFSTATKAYVLSKTITQSLSLMQNVQISAGFVSLNPGSVLNGAIESIERVADALFVIMAVMLVEKFSIGVIFWICFKVLLIGALILRIIYELRPYQLAAGIGGFLGRIALVLLLFFPIMSFITNKIDSAYQPTLEKTMAEVEKQQAEDVIEKYLEETKKSADESGIFDRMSEKLSAWVGKLNPSVLADKAKSLASAAEQQADKLFNLFAGFTLSVVVIPLLMIAILWKVLVLLGSGLKRSYQTALEEQRRGLPERTSSGE